MEISKDGVTGSSLKPEPSSPNEITSHSDVKKVSHVNKNQPAKRKRFIVDCDERPDGSLSGCYLIPLNEVQEDVSLPDVTTEQVMPITEDKVEGSTDKCTPEKCPIPSSLRKRLMEKKLGSEDKSQKKL